MENNLPCIMRDFATMQGGVGEVTEGAPDNRGQVC